MSDLEHSWKCEKHKATFDIGAVCIFCHADLEAALAKLRKNNLHEFKRANKAEAALAEARAALSKHHQIWTKTTDRRYVCRVCGLERPGAPTEEAQGG